MPDAQECIADASARRHARPAGPDVVAADVSRGHRALSRQRHRRFAGLGAALAVGAAVGVAVGNSARDSTTPPGRADRHAKGSGAAGQATEG